MISEDGMYLTYQVNEVNISINKSVLSEILGALTEGIKTIKKEKRSAKFLTIYGILDDMNIIMSIKRNFKSEYQLLFELVNKVLLSRLENRTTITSPDLFLMEVLSKYKKVNFLIIVIKHINTMMNAKHWKHGLA